MLAKDKSNLKIEEIRMHKHHEIHRVKPLMPALCRIRQGKKVIKSAKTPAPRLLTPQQALEKFKGDKTAAANYLGISRTTFWRRLKN